MIWLVWRRQRTTLLLALGLIGATAALMVLGRLMAASAAAELRLGSCLDDPDPAACDRLAYPELNDRLSVIHDLGFMATLVLPVVVGICVGGGLFGRDLEQGTAVFALTQSVSRLRWWATGLLVAGVPVAVAVALLTPLADRALRLQGTASFGRLNSPLFEMTGVMPVLHTLLAFTFAAVAGLLLRCVVGLLLRSVVGAVALTAMAQLTVLVVLSLWVRPLYSTPDEVRTPVPATGEPVLFANAPDGAWWLDVRYLDADGRTIPDSTLSAGSCDGDHNTCVRAAGGVQELTLYHDAAKYWLFQLIEAAIQLTVVAVLLGVGARRLRRIS